MKLLIVTNFNAVITSDNNFKSFECKAKLLENAEIQPASNDANGILKKAAMAAPLK